MSSSSSTATADLVDEWPQHDALFGAQPCEGVGLIKIKISPYDPEKHDLGHRRPAPRDGTSSPRKGSWCNNAWASWRVRLDASCSQQLGTVRRTSPRPSRVGRTSISDAVRRHPEMARAIDADNNFVMDCGRTPRRSSQPRSANESRTLGSHSIAISADSLQTTLRRRSRPRPNPDIRRRTASFLDMFSIRPPSQLTARTPTQILRD